MVTWQNIESALSAALSENCISGLMVSHRRSERLTSTRLIVWMLALECDSGFRKPGPHLVGAALGLGPNPCYAKLGGLRLARAGAWPGRCYPIGLSFHSSRSCPLLQLISAHTYARDTTCDLTFPQHQRPPRKKLSPTLLPVIYDGQMSAMVILGGHVSEEGANAQHALRINAVMILSVKYVANKVYPSTY